MTIQAGLGFRSTVVLSIVVYSLFGQPPSPRSEEDRAAELKKRVIEILQLKPGDTAADVGCGNGFYTIPLARFLGPSGKVYAEDISDSELINLKQLDSETAGWKRLCEAVSLVLETGD